MNTFNVNSGLRIAHRESAWPSLRQLNQLFAFTFRIHVLRISRDPQRPGFFLCSKNIVEIAITLTCSSLCKSLRVGSKANIVATTAAPLIYPSTSCAQQDDGHRGYAQRQDS